MRRLLRSHRAIWCRSLLIALLIPAPSLAQHIFLDVNRDGVCDSRDQLGPYTRSVDVYFDTDRDAAGARATCLQDSSQDLPMLGYSFILRAWGGGSVEFGSWIPGPDASGFPESIRPARSPTDIHIAYVGLAPVPPGLYRLGTLLIRVTGHPRLSFVTSTDISPASITAIASPCPGVDYENTIRLGRDFVDACGTGPGPPRVDSPWQVIQLLYH